MRIWDFCIVRSARSIIFHHRFKSDSFLNFINILEMTEASSLRIWIHGITSSINFRKLESGFSTQRCRMPYESIMHQCLNAFLRGFVYTQNEFFLVLVFGSESVVFGKYFVPASLVGCSQNSRKASISTLMDRGSLEEDRCLHVNWCVHWTNTSVCGRK